MPSSPQLGEETKKLTAPTLVAITHLSRAACARHFPGRLPVGHRRVVFALGFRAATCWCVVLLAAPRMPSLRDWRGWVLHDMPQHDCPFVATRVPQPGNRLCTWPVRPAIGVSACMTMVMGYGNRGQSHAQRSAEPVRAPPLVCYRSRVSFPLHLETHAMILFPRDFSASDSTRSRWSISPDRTPTAQLPHNPCSHELSTLMP